MKHKTFIKATIAILFYVLAGWLSFLKPDWLLYLTVGLGFISYFLVGIVFTPAGQVPLGGQENKRSFGRWCWQLLKGQIAFFILTLVAFVAFLEGGPPYARGDLSFQLALDVFKDFSLWKWAIFPWGVYGLWGIVIAYCTYVKKGSPYFYQIARYFCPPFLQPLAKTATENAASGATISALTVIAAAIVLTLSYGLESVFKTPHFSIPVVTIMILSFLIPVLALKHGRRVINKIAARGMNWLFSFYIILTTIMLLFAAFGNAWFMEAYPHLYKQSQCPQCHAYFANVPIETRFAVLYWGWMFTWMPLAGSYLAKISYGRTLREYILGLYFIPFILMIVALIYGKTPYVWLFSKTQLLLTPFTFVLLAFAGWFIVNALLRGRHHVGIFISGVMPLQDETEDRLSVNTASKKKGLSKHSYSLFMGVLGTLYIHTLAGWYGIQFQVGAMAFPLLGVLYTGFLLLIFWFFKDKVWLNNRNIASFSSKTLSSRHSQD